MEWKFSLHDSAIGDAKTLQFVCLVRAQDIFIKNLLKQSKVGHSPLECSAIALLYKIHSHVALGTDEGKIRGVRP